MTLAATIQGMPRKKPSPDEAMPKTRSSRPKKPPVIYIELPPGFEHIKELMDNLARRHHRKLTGECLQALQEYLSRHELWPPKEAE